MGADPGTTNVYAAYAAKHLLDEVTELRVRDGDNSVCQGHDGFVATFSPWVFIDECLCKAVSYRDGRYHLEPPLTGFEPFDFPELGVLNCYYVDHEESRTLPKYFPSARLVDFKLCMDDVTIETLRVMQRLGLSRKDRVRVGDTSVVPRDVVVSLLPDPKDLAGRMRGKTCVGTLARGLKDGEPRAFYIYNVADHEAVFTELGVQATAYQTGIPPVIAARLIHDGRWNGPGVRSPEEFDPDPFLERLLAGRHAVARPGRHGARRGAESADPAIAGDGRGLSDVEPMFVVTAKARRARRTAKPHASSCSVLTPPRLRGRLTRDPFRHPRALLSD